MAQHRSDPAQTRTGIHRGAGWGATAAAIGAVLVLASGAPAAQGDPLIPVPTVPVTPPGGLIEPPLGVVMPPDTAPAAESPETSARNPRATAPPAAAEPATTAMPTAPAAAPAATAATPAAAVGRSATGVATLGSPAAEAAAPAGKVTPAYAPDGTAGQGPNLVLTGFGLALLGVAAAAGVTYARLRGA
jgi:hypothetical protein